jgi:hypothetical protein
MNYNDPFGRCSSILPSDDIIKKIFEQWYKDHQAISDKFLFQKLLSFKSMAFGNYDLKYDAYFYDKFWQELYGSKYEYEKFVERYPSSDPRYVNWKICVNWNKYDLSETANVLVWSNVSAMELNQAAFKSMAYIAVYAWELNIVTELWLIWKGNWPRWEVTDRQVYEPWFNLKYNESWQVDEEELYKAIKEWTENRANYEMGQIADFVVNWSEFTIQVINQVTEPLIKIMNY